SRYHNADPLPSDNPASRAPVWGRLPVRIIHSITCNSIQPSSTGPLLSSAGRRPRYLPRLRIVRRAVQAQVRQQIDALLRPKLLLQILRHHRQLAHELFVHVLSGDRLQLAALHLQYHALGVVLHQQPGHYLALLRVDGDGLIPRADHERRVEDVRHELIEIAAAIRRNVRSDLDAFTVDLVALGAQLLEDGDARFRIARRLLVKLFLVSTASLAL